ncbi:MAG: hypothetical protein HC835_07315 [Oscillatoriales cyanobacterium RM2_1_1]|nr:hypothetical protein [Oscillatoriales cyanobacterium SM2_3_0]NJO45446.1 hypothetical protein [Oscillatoriales cyanobacterium RM2_1_1]
MIVISLILLLIAIALFQVTKMIADEVEKLVITSIAVASSSLGFIILAWPFKLLILSSLLIMPRCFGFRNFFNFPCPRVCFCQLGCSRSAQSSRLTQLKINNNSKEKL